MTLQDLGPIAARIADNIHFTHWNYSGPIFLSVHAELGEIYSYVADCVDTISEMAIEYYGTAKHPSETDFPVIKKTTVESVIHNLDRLIKYIEDCKRPSKGVENALDQMNQDLRKFAHYKLAKLMCNKE